MRYLLRLDNPFFWLLVVVITVVFRLPQFHGLHHPAAESEAVVLGMGLSEGQLLYSDLGHRGAPLVELGYGLLIGWFGLGAALVIAKVLYLLLFIVALTPLARLLSEARTLPAPSGGAIVVASVFAALPWYAAQLDAMSWLLLPFCIMNFMVLEHSLPRLADTSGRLRTVAISKFFLLGLVWSWAVLTSWLGILLVLVNILLYLILSTPSAREAVAALGGLVTPVLFLLLYFFSAGDLTAFAALTFQGTIGLSDYGTDGLVSLLSAIAWLVFWGPLVLMAALGLLYIRTHFYSVTIKTRRIETSFLLLGIAVLVLAVVAGPVKAGRVALLMLPILVFYGLYFLQEVATGWSNRLATGLLVLGILLAGALPYIANDGNVLAAVGLPVNKSMVAQQMHYSRQYTPDETILKRYAGPTAQVLLPKEAAPTYLRLETHPTWAWWKARNELLALNTENAQALFMRRQALLRLQSTAPAMLYDTTYWLRAQRRYWPQFVDHYHQQTLEFGVLYWQAD